MRSWRAAHNLLAVSANTKETAINTEQAPDVTLLVDMGDVINLEPRRESNADELTGKEEPDTIYDLGNMAAGALTFNKAQPQHFALLMAYALGAISTAAAGSGYEHTITPIADDEDGDRSNPSFTAAQRFGNTVLKRRFASMFVDSLIATFAADDWCKISGQLKGTGKVTDNVTEETIAVTPGADPFAISTSLTLAANAVEGSTAAERLQNVQRIRVELASGVWTDVAFTAVSAATPAVITIEALNAVDINDVDFKVLYIPAESGWMTFPSRVTETPLRVAEMTMKLGGAWSGSAFVGGREMDAEIRSVEWNFANNLELEFVPGAGDSYAARCFRPARTQTLKLNREFRNYILQQHIDDNDTFGVYILAEGAIYDTPHKYQVELIFPKVAVLTAPLSVDGKRVAEAGDLQVLQDDTYGSVIAKVKNLQATYMA
jgi:hypothetical protein